MTEHQPGSREWSRNRIDPMAAKRAFWAAYDATMGSPRDQAAEGFAAVMEYIIAQQPAPAQAPDLAAQVAELRARLDAHTHRYFDGQSIVATDGPSYESMPEPAPTFTTSRKPDPAPVVMTDDEIVAASIFYMRTHSKAAWSESQMLEVDRACYETIRLTVASVRAQLAAMKLDRFDGDPGAHMVINHIIAALKAHLEGV